MSHPAKNILPSYLRRLTNLSGNNRSLLLLRLHAEQLIDVHTLSFLNGEPSFELIKALIANKSKKVCQVLDSRLEANNESSRRLKKLQRIDHFIFEERGSNDLHVGWPFVRGKFSDGSIVRCPLLYFPVSIVQEGQHWALQPRKDAGITFNKSFLLAFAFYNQVKLEEELLDTSFEDFDIDSTVFRTQLYELLRDRLEINFNPDNFLDTLTPFETFKKETLEESLRNGELKLYPEAVLGIFPQAGSQLVPDYLQLIDNDTVTDLEEFFVEKNTGSDGLTAQGALMNNAISEEKIFAPFVMDAYQENAIKAIKHGHSIVVQGPPGTGKSQLICNLLADAIASGKKALLVCQKRAALDVVYDRLKDIELGDFLGLVHDFRNDRKEIYAKIARQVERVEEFKTRNRGIDVIQTERKFFQLCRRIDQVTEELEEFKHALFDDKESGLSVKELYLTSELNGPSINIKQEYPFFNFGELHDFLRKLKTYAQYAARLENDHYVWRERRSFAGFKPSDEKKIAQIVADIPSYQNKVAGAIEKLIGIRPHLEDCETLAAKEDDILGMISVIKDDDTHVYFQSMINESEDETSLLWLLNMERVIMNCYDDELPETTLPSNELGKFQEALQHSQAARTNLIRLIRWHLFSKEKFYLRRVLVANQLNYSKEGLRIMERRIDSRLNLEHHLTALKNKSWLVDLPSNYDKDTLQRWFDRQKLAVRAKLIFNTLREVKDAVSVHKYSRREFGNLFKDILSAISGVREKKAGWLVWLAPYQVTQVILEPAREEEYLKTLHRDFDTLCEYDTLKESLKFFERDVTLKLYDHLGAWDGDAMEGLFQNSLRLAWIDHIETKYPILRAVSSMKIDTLQDELRSSLKEKKKLSKEILWVRARERVYENLEYNRLNNLVTYRDLLHQVTKKKKIWPLRKLIESSPYELFQLVPCWLASPESVSAIFPMTTGLFDIVIFDEASQCFAERGIPAMYRGKQLVVAGDDKQLRPSELYQARWSEGEEENPDLEVDSLLELSARYLATVHLQGHYRSKSLALIDFSNTHFYGGRLQLLPDREVINTDDPPIQYHKVDGVWENQTNAVEAQAVARCVLDILREQPEKEIGVVTFNAPQQMMVLDALEAEALLAGQTLPESLFVKNIENVQGDEKDIIIFSIGYAPDKKGRLMMQFGSLNMAGGENRLNVAVTRAREKIILFTSITPEQLKVDDIRNEGPRLLRDYLAFAREVSAGRYRPQSPIQTQHTKAWFLSRRLQEWSASRMPEFTFDTEALPFTDINVLKDDQYLGVILTDDVRYFSALSAKDVHAYTPALLTQKKWKHLMVFSRNFWKDREKVETELMLFVGSQAVQNG